MKTPSWMPPLVDDTARHDRTKTESDIATDDAFAKLLGEATATSLRPDWVQRAPTWRAKTRRWIIRACWRLLCKTLRKAAARRVVLAPFLLCAATYFVSAIMSLYDRGAFTMIAGFGTLAPIVYWWCGGWAWIATRRRKLRPVVQRAWFVAGYLTIMVLGAITAGWRVGPPLPGLWLLSGILFSLVAAWFRRDRPDPVVDEDERYKLWAKEKKVKDTVLGPITDLEGPRRWTAEVDLTESDMLVDDLAAKGPHIAKRNRVSRSQVIIDQAVPGVDQIAKLTVVLENPLFKPVEFDESWVQNAPEGCFRFHDYSDSGNGYLRLYEPMSGTVNALFSGDSNSGKSGGMFLGAVQAMLTGRVYPIVCDGQGGQSLPALAGEAGIAPMKAVDAESTYYTLLKVYAVMRARSEYLQRYTWINRFGDIDTGIDFFDQDLLRTQPHDPKRKLHPLFWAILLVIVDEAHLFCKDPEWGAQITHLLAMMVKLSRKTGVAIWLATQYPGLEELGNNQALRQNLINGNTVCFANSTKLTGAMVLPSDLPEPSTIPKTTPDGKTTAGMCIVSSRAPGSSRSTIARAGFIERKAHWARIAAERIHPLDELAAAAMAAVDIDAQEVELQEMITTTVTKGSGKAAPATTAAAAPAVEDGPAWRRGTVIQRCVAYMQHLVDKDGPNAETTSGILAAETGSEMNAVCNALRRASKPTSKRPVPLCHEPADRPGIWRLGPAPAPSEDKELVGV